MSFNNFTSAALGVMVGAGIVGAGVVLLDSPPVPLPVTPTPDVPFARPFSPVVDADLVRRIENLERLTRTPTRTVVEAAVPTDLVSRLRAVETQLSELRERHRLAGLEAIGKESPERMRAAISELRVSGHRNGKRLESFVISIARIPVRLRFLESWPDHEDAPEQLRCLITNFKETGQKRRALASINRFGARVGLSDSELDLLRFGVAGSGEQRVEFGRRILRDRPDPTNIQRADAILLLARTLDALRHHQEAVGAIDAFLAEFSSSRQVVGYRIDNARKLRMEFRSR